MCWCTDLVNYVVETNVSQGKVKTKWNQSKSIEINEKEDESVNPQQNITELPQQIESGKIFYLDYLTHSPESLACNKTLLRIFKFTV